MSIYNYKTYNDIDNSWIFGELEIIVNEKDLSKKYFIVNENGKYESSLNNICEITLLRAGATQEPIYDKDIINIKFNDDTFAIFIVKRGNGKIQLNIEDAIIEGIMLHDFDKKDYLFSDNLLNNSEAITVVGNVLENHLNDFQ